MAEPLIPARPPTPQILLHRLPDKPSSSSTPNPSKYIVLIMGSTGVAGKVQVARSVSSALSCPLYQGDSMHESSAKAASVGASVTGAAREDSHPAPGDAQASGPNNSRYQRMWLSKMTRTGLLFPEESRPANMGFTGFGGTASKPASRRGSADSAISVSSNNFTSQGSASGQAIAKNRPPAVPGGSGTAPNESATGANAGFELSEEVQQRRSNPILMVLTHPELEPWHKSAIVTAVEDYSIGVIFVPMYAENEELSDDEELPILQPLDPTKMTSFPISFGAPAASAQRSGGSAGELKLEIDVHADVEGMTAEIIRGVREMIEP